MVWGGGRAWGEEEWGIYFLANQLSENHPKKQMSVDSPSTHALMISLPLISNRDWDPLL